MLSSLPILHGRPWLAWLLLLAGSGAAPAAPPPSALSHIDQVNAPRLWPAQAAHGRTDAANLSLEILPSRTVDVGGKVSFSVSASRTGYLILVDVDVEGRMSQIFPTPELLAQSDGRDVNRIKPGIAFVVPSAAAQQRGFEYVIAPPTGSAVMVAILSERSVQLLDLPDLPRKLQSQAEAFSYLTAWTSALRIPDDSSGKLMSNVWSFDVKSYSIR